MQSVRFSLRRLPFAGRYARPRVSSHRFAASRRNYASATDAVKKASSDMPWLLAAAVVTVPGVYFALQPSASAGHGGHDDHGDHAAGSKDHHDEDSDQNQGQEDSAPAEQSSKSPKAEGNDASKATEDSHEGGDDPKDKSNSGEKKAAKVDGVNFDGGSVKRESDAKGGVKKRIDSDLGKNIGEGVSSDTEDDMSNKQRGYSNTDTRHSTDPSKDPGKSKKGEGTADTAKVKGTVDGSRPQV